MRISDWSSDVCSSDLILVISGETDDALLVGRNREMIGPEMDEAFGEGGLRRDRGGQARARGLAIMAAETGARHAAHRLDVRAVILAHFRVLRLAVHRPPLVVLICIGR